MVQVATSHKVQEFVSNYPQQNHQIQVPVLFGLLENVSTPEKEKQNGRRGSEYKESTMSKA